ncbi:hypothetical protein K438DRAFT_1764807 [Mycena galopus ATCC 62051]|nr:hypothetical protein K438DRAFT_1764807 [Mycena galopus ATCC 62051]
MCRRAFGRQTVRQGTGEQDSMQEQRAHAKREYAEAKSRSTLSRGGTKIGLGEKMRAVAWREDGVSAERRQKAQHTNQMKLWAFLRGGWFWRGNAIDVFGVLRRELGGEAWDGRHVNRVLLAALAVGEVKSRRRGKARKRSIHDDRMRAYLNSRRLVPVHPIPAFALLGLSRETASGAEK